MRPKLKRQIDELQEILDEKQIKICFKEEGYDVWWHQVAAWFVIAMFWFFRKVTFGRFKKTFDDFTTTFGRYIYFGCSREEYDMSKVWVRVILRHELIHVFQMEKYGPALYSFLYLFFLPAVWTWRSKLELEAYTQNMLVRYEELGRVPAYVKSHIISQFASPNYLFMRLGSGVEYDVYRRAQEIEDGKITGLWPYRPEALKE